MVYKLIISWECFGCLYQTVKRGILSGSFREGILSEGFCPGDYVRGDYVQGGLCPGFDRTTVP